MHRGGLTTLISVLVPGVTGAYSSRKNNKLTTHKRKDLRLLGLLLAVCFLFVFALALSASAQYVTQNLVASNSSFHPRFVDSNLIDPWGIAIFPTSPFWVSDQNTSTSTLYNAN